MELAEVHGLVDLVGSAVGAVGAVGGRIGAGVAGSGNARVGLTAAVAASARVRAWLDGRDAALAAALADVVPDAERALADAARCSRRQAGRTLDRAATATALPSLGGALARGEVSGEHIDVVGRAWRRLEPDQRRELAAGAVRLVELAGRVSPPELERAVAAEVRRIQRDDGVARLKRQKRAARCRTWVDGDGMWCLSGRFDPETGLRLDGRIRATVEALFAQASPEHCPSDPLERQAFLRAAAVAAVIEGDGAGRGGRPDLMVVLDTTATDDDGGPAVDWGLPIELPVEVLHRLFATAAIHPVILCRGAVVHASGRLELGRTTRLANRAQRRALRALYPTCAIPGCPVRFQDCTVHHVVWWDNGGCTDLVNLLPLCCRHHHAVHDEGWRLDLTPDRTLTITYPDGTTETVGRPRRGCSRPASSPAGAAGAPSDRNPRDVPLRT